MHWLPEASNFVLKNEIALKKKNVACFALSYIINDGRKFWKKRLSNNFKTSCQLIDPIDTMIFGGKIDQRMPTPASFIFGLSNEAPLDYRNNRRIKNWANGLINALK
jgi:menaquinone-dependent protoporphyrinogen IX oxidase